MTPRSGTPLRTSRTLSTGNALGRRDFLRIGVSAAALASLGVACGNGDTTDGETGSPTAGGSPTSPPMELVGWNSGSINPGFADGFILMAAQQGFLEEEGLDVEFTYTNSGEQIQAAAADRLDIVLLAPGAGFAAIETGVDLKMVGVPLGRVRELLVVRSEITSPQDLVGKDIAIQQPGTSSAIFVGAALDANDIAQEDVRLVPTGDDPQRLAALIAGRVDAAPVGVENLATIEADDNLSVLIELGDVVPNALQGAWFSTGKVISERPDDLTACLRAYARGIRHGFDNLDEATALAMDRLESLPEDEPVVSAALTGLAEGRFVNPDIDWTDEQVEGTQQLNVDLESQTSVLPADQVADRQFVDAVLADLGTY